MKLGMEFPQKWKEKSIKDQIPLSDMLYGYAVENIMLRLESSSFKEYLWLANEQAIGEDAYRKTVKERLEFFYVESGKRNFLQEGTAGSTFKKELVENLVEELFIKANKFSQTGYGEIQWECQFAVEENKATLYLNCSYMEVQIPITLGIVVAKLDSQRPKVKEKSFLLEERKGYTYLAYSRESMLSEALFEMMRKLELISNMEVYDTINEILKSQSISGRHVIEELKVMGEKEPKVISMKRLEQITSYRTYGYMKKKWQQYVRNRKEEAEEWEVVMDRVISFLTPLWKSLCENEIFFDDWMPELGRFLG